MAEPAWQSLDSPVTNATAGARQVPLYRFYLLSADDHIARRREDYFVDDTAAIAAAWHVIGGYPGVEIWCEKRKVISLSREEVARLETLASPRSDHRAVRLIGRNKALLQQAAATCHRTEALHCRSRPANGHCWARPRWAA